MSRALTAATSVPLSLPESAITRLSSTLPIRSAFACLDVKKHHVLKGFWGKFSVPFAVLFAAPGAFHPAS
jgi:hypothetical protein